MVVILLGVVLELEFVCSISASCCCRGVGNALFLKQGDEEGRCPSCTEYENVYLCRLIYLDLEIIVSKFLRGFLQQLPSFRIPGGTGIDTEN
jgi:hypothetical protein